MNAMGNIGQSVKFMIGAVVLGLAIASAAYGKPHEQPPTPDFTKGGKIPDGSYSLDVTNDWNLGPTDALKLPAMGIYSDTAPYDCPKSGKIFELGCQAIARKGLGGVSIPNDLNCSIRPSSRRWQMKTVSLVEPSGRVSMAS